MEQNTPTERSSSVSGDDVTAVAAVAPENSVDEAAEPYDKGTSVLLDDVVDDSGRDDANTPVRAAVGSEDQTANAGGSGGSTGGGGAVTGAAGGGGGGGGGDTTASGVPAPRRGPSDPSSGSSFDYKTTDLVASNVHEGYVQPSSYLLRRPRAASRTMPAAREETPVERDQKLALRSIRAFLKVRTSYDVLPLSYRLIVFDTGLLVKKSLNILVQNGIVSAPLWDSKTSTFAGMLTTSDYINLIQYYWQNPNDVSKIDQFRLDSLRDIEKAIGVAPIETISVHPLRPLYEACRRLIEARARRIPIIDVDDDTKRAMVVSVLTQYRLLKFVAINVSDTQLLRVPLKYLPNVGTYNRVQTADMDTPVIKVIHMLVSKQISSVPILNSDGVVVNVFEAVDVITLIKGGNYDCLTLPVGEALSQRAPDFPGIFTCSLDDRLDSIFDTIRKSRVHRFVVIDDGNRLKGILTLSDILKYILLEGENEDQT